VGKFDEQLAADFSDRPTAASPTARHRQSRAAEQPPHASMIHRVRRFLRSSSVPEKWTRPAGAVALAEGCTELAAWQHGVALGHDAVPAARAALILILAGMVLLLRHRRPAAAASAARVGERACGLMAVALAVAPAAEGYGMPAVLAFNGGTLGAALLVLDARRNGVSLAQLCCIPAALASMLALLQCLYGACVSSPTHAIAFLAAAGGIMCMHPRLQPVAALASNGSGGFVLRRLLPMVLAILIAGGWLRVAGQDAGMYGTGLGTSLVVTLIVACTIALFWWCAWEIDRIDASRLRAEEDLRSLNAELELRVAERTAQLQAANRELKNEIAAGKRTRAALRANQESYRFLFECNPLPLFVLDHENLRYAAVNQAAIQQYGYSREEFVGMSVERLLPPDELARTRQYLGTSPQGQNCIGIWRNLKRDGELIEVEVFHHVVRLDGRPHSIALALDITERRRTEEALRNYTARLQILSQRLLNVQEAERSWIARELHDDIGQTLTAVKLGMQSVRKSIGDAAAAARLEESIQLAARVLEQVRSVSLDLRPPLLDELGLIAALDSHIKNHAQRAGLEVHFDAEPLPQPPSPEVATACFRVVQEALTNVMRHAQASHVWIKLRLQDGALRLRVVDDGKGYDPEATRRQALKGKSIGLLSMSERATLIGGQCDIVSSPGTGTSVRASFPLRPPAEPDHSGESA
jgi:PAS domain S-box-containing protein